MLGRWNYAYGLAIASMIIAAMLMPALAWAKPTISASGDHINFGRQHVNEGPTDAAALVISNIGNGRLTLNPAGIVPGGVSPDDMKGLWLSGPNASDFTIVSNGIPDSGIAAGESAEIMLVFDPSARGVRTATLTIFSNPNYKDTEMTVALTGIGFIPAALTTNTVGEGTISVSKDAPYDVGDELTLTATPAEDWAFVGWSGDLTGSENPATLTLTGDASVTATFKWTGPELTIVKIGQGRVTQSPPPPYKAGAVVTLTFSPSNGQQFSTKPDVPPAMPGDPDAGWVFSHWSYTPDAPQFAAASLANPVQITVNADTTIYATFLNLGSTCHPTASQEAQLMSFLRSAWIGWDGVSQEQADQMFVKAENYLKDFRQYNEWWGQEAVCWWNNFNRTSVGAIDKVGDAMCFMGMHIMAMSMKSACMPGDQETIDDLNRVLDAVYRNIMITGTPGRTARFSGPSNNAAYQWYYGSYSNGAYAGVAPWTDYTWLGYPSRDTQTGLFTGLAACLKYCTDEAVVARTRAIVEIIIDRLIADNWSILDGKGHTTANNSTLQALQYRVAYKANPTKYASFLNSINSHNLSLSTNYNLYNTNYWQNNLDWMRGIGITMLETNPTKMTSFGVTWNNRYLSRRYDMNGLLAAATCLFDPKTGVVPADAYATLQGALVCAPDPVQWYRAVNLSVDPRFTVYNATYVNQAALPHQRAHDDWDWQRSAALAKQGDNSFAYQYPGFDVYTTYWMARVAGVIPPPAQ